MIRRRIPNQNMILVKKQIKLLKGKSQVKEKAMKDYLSNIFEQEEKKLFNHAGDSKKAEEKERVELEQEIAMDKKIKNVFGTPEPVSPKKAEEEIKIENREEKSDISQLEEVMIASASAGGKVREEKVLEETRTAEANPKTETLSEADSVLKNEEESKKALHTLKNCRRSIHIEGSEKIYYFQNNGKNIIDIVSLIHHITKILNKVKSLYEQLSQTVSPREKFYLKQEAINNQYTLRDLIKESVKMCTQESYSLPDCALDIFNIQSLQKILDILDIQNWSQDHEFKAFIDHIESFVLPIEMMILKELQPDSSEFKLFNYFL